MSVYKYTYATTLEAARQEAQQVVALLQSHGLIGTMVWWDVEDRGALQPLGVTKLTECIRAAQEVITAAGYRFGLYVGLYVYKERWFDFDAFAGARLWVARYYKGYTPCSLQMRRIRAISHRLIDGLRYGSIRAAARLQASKAMLI